jgi:hypothetical protein
MTLSGQLPTRVALLVARTLNLPMELLIRASPYLLLRMMNWMGRHVRPHLAGDRCCSAGSAHVFSATRLYSGRGLGLSRSGNGTAKAVAVRLEGRRNCDCLAASAEMAEVVEVEIPERDGDDKTQAAKILVADKGSVVDHSLRVKMVVGAKVDPERVEEVVIVGG